jgi:hypothetical protein
MMFRPRLNDVAPNLGKGVRHGALLESAQSNRVAAERTSPGSHETREVHADEMMLAG